MQCNVFIYLLILPQGLFRDVTVSRLPTVNGKGCYRIGRGLLNIVSYPTICQKSRENHENHRSLQPVSGSQFRQETNAEFRGWFLQQCKTTYKNDTNERQVTPMKYNLY